MKNRSLLIFVVFVALIPVGAGCSYLRTKETTMEGEELGHSNPRPDPDAKITKDVLRQRLSGKNIDFIETSPYDKPNPLTLDIKITKGYRDSFKARLNGDEYDFDGLAAKLNWVFKDRETYGVFRDGSNEIEKRIQLAATDDDLSYYERNNITVGDFERLIDDLREKGITDIVIVSTSSSNPVAKTINVGVVNGKAVKLVQPDYPAAARVVKVSGLVNVIVTIDEQGNVISAKAESGHPLLRASAERAARASKFSVTMIAGQPATVSGTIVYDFTPPK